VVTSSKLTNVASATKASVCDTRCALRLRTAAARARHAPATR
jgi:hypothetical protein